VKAICKPAIILIRIDHIERVVSPFETAIQREQRAELARWLLADNHVVDLVADYGALVEENGKTGLYEIAAGRDLIMRMVASFYRHTEASVLHYTLD
jgi:hypothetical protein